METNPSKAMNAAADLIDALGDLSAEGIEAVAQTMEAPEEGDDQYTTRIRNLSAKYVRDLSLVREMYRAEAGNAVELSR